MSKIEVDTIAPQSGTTVTLGESGDTVNIPSGVTLTNSGTATGFGISWQSDIKTSAFTAVAGEGYWINTTSGAVTMTLPGSASVGDTIEFVDYARTWGTNAVTINQNSLNFQGATSPNPVYDVSGQHVRIVYSGATQGWIPTTDDDVSDKPVYLADFLVIAGGGGGGTSDGSHITGGGGAGGYRASFNNETSGGGGSSESSLNFKGGTVYTITVGAGGAAQANGVDSSISGTGITTITSIGGGNANNGPVNPGDGGSGGGETVGGQTSGGSGTANQGFDGGGSESPLAAGGGGGGAGSAGANAATLVGGNGGNGVASTITGSSVTRAGGGGGGVRSDGTVGSGGSGGGGNGEKGNNVTAPAGTVNTGSGGGGNGQLAGVGTGGTGGAGGSGVVILRMLTSDYSGTTTGSPTVTTDGSDTILVFNSSGSYTG